MTKSSSAAVRTRRRLANTSTCPYVRFNIHQNHLQLQYALCYMSKRMYGHVLVLPN